MGKNNEPLRTRFVTSWVNDLVGEAVKSAANHAKRLVVVTVTMERGEAPYQWFHLWLEKHKVLSGVRDVVAIEKYHATSNEPAVCQPRTVGGLERMPFAQFVPAQGSHVFKYGSQWFWLQKEQQNLGTWMRDRYILHTIGKDTSVFQQILEEGRALAIANRSDTLRIMLGNYDYWSEGPEHAKRTIDSVILPKGSMSAIVDDIQNFLSGHAWYEQTSVPYQRGYLLYGPPGGGKTSTVLALAAHFGMSIYCLQLNNADMDDRRIVDLLSKVPMGNIVLIEDVDAVFNQRNESQEKSNDLTFSGLLNALDGALASPGRLLFLTTNHRERLDSALIRPGRIDYELNVDYANREQAEDLFGRFYPDASTEQRVAFGVGLGDQQVSMSSLQGLMLAHRYSPEMALEKITTLVEDEKNEALSHIQKVSGQEPNASSKSSILSRLWRRRNPKNLCKSND